MVQIKNPVTIVQQGGGGGEVESKYIDFYDYDGTRLYSWTKQELDNATELPANPTHAGLTSRGWNWTLAQLRDQGTPMDVGQMYRPTDGKTHLFVEVDDNTREPNISFSIASGLAAGTTVATIDWGDGSSTEDIATTSTSAAILGLDHTYTQNGRYEVTIDIPDAVYGYVLPDSGVVVNYSYYFKICSFWRGQNSSGTSITVKNTNYSRQIKEVWVGKNIKLGTCPFGQAGIEKVVLSDTLQNSDIGLYNSRYGGVFYNCYNLKFYVWPTTLTLSNMTGDYRATIFGVSKPINGASLPYGITVYSSNNLKRGIPPKTATYASVSGYRELYLPDGLASLNSLNNYLSYVKYPSSLTSIPNFYTITYGPSGQGTGQVVYPTIADFSDFTSVPTRASTSGPNSANLPGLVIKVPAALEADWKADASWSALADYIVGV